MKNKPYPYYHNEKIYTLKDFLTYCETKYADKIAFSFTRQKQEIKKTYTEFVSDVNSLGAYLISKYERNTKIALLGENSYEWILSYFAAANSGNIIVPLDKSMPVDSIENIINEVGAKLLFCSEQYRDYAEKLQKSIKINIIFMSEITSDLIPEFADKTYLMKKIKICPDDICAVVYTSGTTGYAKGVMLTHKNISINASSGMQSVHYGKKAVIVLPLYHAYGLSAQVLCAIFWGVESYINSSMKNLFNDLINQKPYFLITVPTIVDTFYKTIWNETEKSNKTQKLKRLIKISNSLLMLGIDIRHILFRDIIDKFGGNLNMIVCGGASLDLDKQKFFESIGIHIVIGYGITECSPYISVNRNKYFRYGSAGLPITCADVKIDKAEGETEGEILVKGDMVMKGYYNNPELTAEVMDGEYFRTGDIGYQDKDGFLFITGRKKNMIVLSNGKNVYPEELEAEWSKLSEVKEILVYEKDKSIVAEIFPDKNALDSRGVSDYYEWFNRRLDDFNKTHPAYKNISRIILRDTEFPKTTSMKIKRNYNQ